MFLTNQEEILAFAKRYEEAEIDPLCSRSKIGFIMGMDQITFEPILMEKTTGQKVKLEYMGR